MNMLNATRRERIQIENAHGADIEPRHASRRAADVEPYQSTHGPVSPAQWAVTGSAQGYPDTFRLADHFVELLDRKPGGQRSLRPFRYLHDVHAWPAIAAVGFTCLGYGVHDQPWHEWWGGGALTAGIATLAFTGAAHLAAVVNDSDVDSGITRAAGLVGAGLIAGGAAMLQGPAWISVAALVPELLAGYSMWHGHRERRAERQRADIIAFTDVANPGPFRGVPGGVPAQQTPQVVSWEATRLHNAFGAGGLRVPGIVIRSITASGEDAHRAVIALPTGSKFSQDWVIAKQNELASNLGCRHLEVTRGAVRNEVVVSWYDGEDRLADTILWPGPSTTTFEDPIPLGIFGNMQIVEQPFLWNHTLVGGDTDNGKSGVMNVILCSTLPHQDVVRIGIDCKPGAPEFGPYRRVMHKLATNPADGIRVLNGIWAVIQARGEFIGIDGESSYDEDGDEDVPEPVRKWDTRYGPYILAAIDELAELTSEYPQAAKLLRRIRQIGRYVGVFNLDATQYPEREVFGSSTAARKQYQVRIGLACSETGSINVILGAGAQGRGWRLDELPHKGSFMIKSRQYLHPQAARAYYITDQMIAEMVNRYAADCPALDELSAAAFDEAYEADPADGGGPDRPRGGGRTRDALDVASDFNSDRPFRLHAVPLVRYPNGTAVEANWQQLWQAFSARPSHSVDELVDYGFDRLTSRDSVRKALRAWLRDGHAWKDSDGRYYPTPYTDRREA